MQPEFSHDVLAMFVMKVEEYGLSQKQKSQVIEDKALPVCITWMAASNDGQLH